MTKKKSDILRVQTLKDINLFSPFDVSKWCAENGMVSVYLERATEKIMDVCWAYRVVPGWEVRDFTQPGVVIKKFSYNGEEHHSQIRRRAEAWVEANYDIPMKYLPAMKACFTAPAVDMIIQEVNLMQKIWHSDPVVRAQVPKLETEKFLIKHPARPKSLEFANGSSSYN